MKKILNILIILAACMSFYACSNEEDDVFGKSSSERIEEALTETNTVLTSAKNGWLMKYYGNPSSTNYGGYNVLCKFNNDNTVTVASEMFPADASATSHYKLEQSAGVVLSFDGYNKIFHAFSDPDGSSLGISSANNGKGFYGDLEFRVVSATADSIVMTGKKHGARIVMTPLAENVNWADYLNSVIRTENKMVFTKAVTQIGGKEMNVKYSSPNRTLVFTYSSDEGETVQDEAQYLVTPTGLDFYEPTEINGVTITGFIYNNETDTYVAVNDNNVVLTPIVPPINEQFLEKTWYISPEGMSAAAALYFNKAVSGSAAGGEIVFYMYFAYDAAKSSQAFVFASGDPNSGFYKGSFYFNMTPIGENQLTIAMTGYDNNGNYYYNNADYKYIRALFDNTWNLETDNLKTPTYVKLVKSDNPDVYFTVYSRQILYPFGK